MGATTIKTTHVLVMVAGIRRRSRSSPVPSSIMTRITCPRQLGNRLTGVAYHFDVA
jgi:hypothetical protein